jgi:hypothetical protein
MAYEGAGGHKGRTLQKLTISYVIVFGVGTLQSRDRNMSFSYLITH